MNFPESKLQKAGGAGNYSHRAVKICSTPLVLVWNYRLTVSEKELRDYFNWKLCLYTVVATVC